MSIECFTFHHHTMTIITVWCSSSSLPHSSILKSLSSIDNYAIVLFMLQLTKRFNCQKNESPDWFLITLAWVSSSAPGFHFRFSRHVQLCEIISNFCWMCLVIVVIDSVPRYTLSIHSSKALLVEQKMLHATALADAVIQLAIVKGERHEVTVVNLSQRVRQSLNLCGMTVNTVGFVTA